MMEDYEYIRNLSETKDVQLLRHRGSGWLCVRKVLAVYNADIYAQLMQAPVPGIPRIYEIIPQGDRLIVIEEYIPGLTLEQILFQHGPAPEEWTCGMMKRLCAVVERLHALTPAIIHRDIKPSNIIVTAQYDVYLIDMNAARYESPKEARDTRLMGTPGYAAPEQYGYSASDKQSDIYALGAVMNKMLCGCLPAERMADGRLSDIVVRCTQMDPRERYLSVSELRDDLKRGRYSGRKYRRYLPPGFRSGDPLHMIVALVFDAAVAWLAWGMIATSLSGATAYNLSIVGLVVIAYLLIVAIITDYMEIQEKLHIHRLRPAWLRAPAVTAVCAFVLLIIYLIDRLIAWRFG